MGKSRWITLLFVVILVLACVGFYGYQEVQKLRFANCFDNVKRELTLAGLLMDEAEHSDDYNLALQKLSEASVYITNAQQHAMDMQKYARTDSEKELVGNLMIYVHYVKLYNDAIIYSDY